MKVLYVEDLASHNDSESWPDVGNCIVQALTGGEAGQVLSRERHLFGVPTRWVTWKAIPGTTQWRVMLGPHAVRDPAHVSKHLTRKPGDPEIDHGRWAVVRAGNPEGVRRR